MTRLHIIRQFFRFLTQTGKWWLMPIALLLVILGALLILAKGSALAPFIYTLF